MLGYLLATGAQGVLPGVTPGHPHLAAECPDRRAVDDTLDNTGPGGHVVTFVRLEALQHYVSHPLVVTVELWLGRREGLYLKLRYDAHTTRVLGSRRTGHEQTRTY
jgi:hypothetical protein